MACFLDSASFDPAFIGFHGLLQGKASLEFSMEKDFLESSRCRLSLAKQEFVDGNVAFAVAKGNSLPTFFNP